MTVWETVAERLADPARVRAIVIDSIGQSNWRPASLVEGYAGISLLFSNLGEHRIAHTYLAAAVAEGANSVRGSLFVGDISIGFAATVAARRAGDYRSLTAAVNRSAERALSNYDEQQPFSYDVVSGLAGLGRYLLAANLTDPLRHLLSIVAAMAEPVRDGTDPPWLVPGPPNSVDPPERFPRGHFNLGLAHGAAGPLALLALALRAKVEVPGQRDAIETIAPWLISQLQGPLWPHFVTPDGQTGPTKPTWCYGTPGVARAVQLAGLAIGWQRTAVTAMESVLQLPRLWELQDASLCHGAAGLLHITTVMSEDDHRLRTFIPELTRAVTSYFDADAPLCFRYTDSGMSLTENRAGMLEGASGVALALMPSTVPWDGALLLT